MPQHRGLRTNSKTQNLETKRINQLVIKSTTMYNQWPLIPWLYPLLLLLNFDFPNLYCLLWLSSIGFAFERLEAGANVISSSS
jgi:hypothetical protein